MSKAPEALVVALAKQGGQDAFAELVVRRQAWIRNLLRHLSGDAGLADDLAQQVFLNAWRDIKRLRDVQKFGGWLKRLAVNVWLKHQRKSGPLFQAQDIDDAAVDGSSTEAAEPVKTGDARDVSESPDVAMDLERALSSLGVDARLCIVLHAQGGMSHQEICDVTELPLGTIKSHIRRGTQHLAQLLSAYAPPSTPLEGEQS